MAQVARSNWFSRAGCTVAASGKHARTGDQERAGDGLRQTQIESQGDEWPSSIWFRSNRQRVYVAPSTVDRRASGGGPKSLRTQITKCLGYGRG